MTQVLNIYVARHCFGTAEATRLAAEIRKRLPLLQVKVIILDEAPEVETPNVPATPSYFLDGRLLFLGNPRLDELVTRICSFAQGKGGNHV